MEQDNEIDKDFMDEQPIDFGCEYSENLPEIFERLNISLALTSYQVGRLIFVRSSERGIDLNYKSFPRPMGLCATEQGLTLGVFAQIFNFQREDGLLEQIKQPLQPIENDITAPRIKAQEPEREQSENEQSESAAQAQKASERVERTDSKEMDERPQALNERPQAINERPQADESGSSSRGIEEDQNQSDQMLYQKALYQPVDERVDACFIARSSHFSGMINIHDIEWGNEGLWVVNSSFSCLCTVEPDFSFVPRWKPFFISDLKPEDRCHLNGMALKDGYPAYVTTFSQADRSADWRKSDENSGTLMDVKQNKILIEGLNMPHSPRWYRDKVYFCNSGLGLVCRYDVNNNKQEVIAQLQGFTRGMDFYGPLLFVGLSKVRAGDVTNPAPIAEKYDETYSGIWIINLDDHSIVGFIKFTGNVDQIYDVAVVTGCTYPELIEPSHPRIRNHFSHPDL